MKAIEGTAKFSNTFFYFIQGLTWTPTEQYNARTYNILISLLRPRPQPGAYKLFFSPTL